MKYYYVVEERPFHICRGQGCKGGVHTPVDLKRKKKKKENEGREEEKRKRRVKQAGNITP